MLAIYAPLIGGRNVSLWPRLTNSSHLSKWCQEISLCKNIKAWILRANHHEPPRHQPSDDFAHLCTLGRSIIEGDAKWDVDLRFIREFRYTKGYWEWTEDVLSRCGDRLCHIKIYDAVYASLFTYDHNSDIVKAFCEAWCPLKNTLVTSAGEMPISLWDLHELAGLPMTDCLYDEVVPSALELTGVDEKRERFIPRSNVNSIRPSTFKMASLMANGRRVDLAIPVLASIYEGLNTIATSLKPVELRGPKMTRFSGEGGAKYYEPREARKQIHKTEFVSWACNMLVKDGSFKFVDDGHAEELDYSYFVAIHSSYLTLRQGGRFIIEPYSPHRFGRQFGPKSIKITLKRKKDEDKQVDGGENDPPHALIPLIVIECDSQAAVLEASKGKCSSDNVADSESSNKDRHWKRQRKELEDEVQSIDVGEESETSHSSTMTPPLGMGLRRKQSPPSAAVSVFKGESFLFNYQKRVPSKVEESLNTFFAKVRAYDEARSLSSEKLSRSLHEQQLKEVETRLQDVQAKASEEASEIQSAMDELEHVEEDIVVFKGTKNELARYFEGEKAS
ncbi:hypothetical protein Sango_1159400 [Sesamum angolense]|uniref:Aminotransferase-like plant mobile domain-containing protein n=1 Tax=Sesamum angolense TaxID=2727404 RepID=A0AAE2BWR5_9LAMI|nr:hypothetical protein Sango_1159400 [Sesamum angolense]